MYRLEIFTDQMEYASATVVSKSQNIDLDYLAYDAFSIETQLIEAKKGYFVHITQDNEFVADGIISDVRPDKKTQKISIRPIQALFDSEIFYDPISSSIQWLADTITSYYITNTDAPQNRPIDLTFTLSADSCSLIENFKDVGDTVNLLSVIETALKTYSVVVDTWIDMSDLRIKVNIYQQTETKELEADLENVLESDVTLGDSYGSINKALVRKYDYVETTSGGETTKEVRVLGDFEYYRLSDDSIVLSTDTYDQSLRIFPVFWDLILIEKTSEMTDAEWLEEALSQATEVLTPETYDQEIVLKYHKDDKLVRPMDIKIGSIITVHLKGETYTSILAAKRIEGNTVTLTLGAVRTELTKKLSMDRIGGGTSGGGGGGASGGAPGPQGVGISSVVQTTTSYVSEGENIITVTKTDGSTSTFSVRNGAQGAQGTAAGFGTPTATANTLAAGASATASVTASGGSQAKIFNFTFGIPKGDTGAKGDTGDAAGFANPTATATTLSPGSAAAASVTASGGNTMKQFDFSFGIPQGEKGDKGDKGDTGSAAGFGTPTASATTIAAGSSATASVTASGSNTSKIFNFTFGIPKGDTGATGPTGPTGPAGSSIQSIARTGGTGEAGSTDTYTITLTNGNTTTFQVKNGNDGRGLAMRKATLTANGWSNNSQTVQISASASAASDFLSIPEAETNDIYAGAGVKMTSVSINEGTVDCTFTCTTTPTADVDTVILVSTSNESIEEYLNGIVDDMTDLYNQTEADFNTASGLYVKKAGDTMTGNLTVPTVIGNLTGTATKATSDASGNNIKTTYLSGGSVSQPTFTGTQATIEVEGTPTGTVSRPTFSGNELTSTGTYTPAGSVSQPTFTGDEMTSTGSYTPTGSVTVTPTVTLNTTTVNSITAVGSLSSLGFTPNATSKNMAISWNAGTLPTKGANTTVATSVNSATATGSFSGTAATISVKGTPDGTVSKPTFSGTQASLSLKGTPSGTVSQPTFTGNEMTATGTYIPAGTVSRPTFTGTHPS